MSAKSAAPKSAPVAAAPVAPARQRAEKGSAADITVRLPTDQWKALVALTEEWYKASGVRVSPSHLAGRAIATFLASKPQAPKVTF